MSVNGKNLEGLELPQIIKILREASSPRELTFRDVELYNLISQSAAAVADAKAEVSVVVVGNKN